MFSERREQKKEIPQVDNEVVLYHDGKAIIQDDFGDFFYQEIPEELVVMGEVTPVHNLTPIDQLTRTEREDIFQRLNLR